MDETIGLRLVALRERARMSLAEVARAGGYAGPSSVQNYFRPDYDSELGVLVAKRLADALEGRGDPPIQRNEIYELSEFKYFRGNQASQPSLSFGGSATGTVGWNASAVPGSLVESDDPRDLPVYNADIAPERTFDVEGSPTPIQVTLINLSECIETVRMPVGSDASRRYVIFAPATSMDPRIRAGEPILIAQFGRLSPGSEILVLLKPNAEQEPHEDSPEHPKSLQCVLGTLAIRTSSYVDLEQYCPPLKFRVPAESIHAIHRVVPWYDLAGL